MSESEEYLNVTDFNEDGELETTRRVSYDDLPPELAKILRERVSEEPVALPDFPDQPGRYKIRFAPEAALEYLDLRERGTSGRPGSGSPDQQE